MGEVLLNSIGKGRFRAYSAGSHPKSLHPNAVRVMRDYGVDISGRRAKHLDRYLGQSFGAVVTLCDRVKEVCPEFPGADPIHWSVPEPTDEADFDTTATELETRISFLVAAINAKDSTYV